MPDTAITKDDTDRERARLKEAVEAEPDLELLLREFPEDYDPEEEPEAE